MRTRVSWLACGLLFAGNLAAQEVLAEPADSDLETALTFEGGGVDELPVGWSGGPPGTVSLSSTIVRSGTGAGFITRSADSESRFSSLTYSLPAEFSGESIELHGFLRTQAVRGYAGLWLRVDDESGVLYLDNMSDRGVIGSTDWTEYSVMVRLDPSARSVVFGALLVGDGQAWVDDLRLLVDGKPIQDAAKRTIEKTVLEIDREFDEGSGISLTDLTAVQVQNLHLLAKVWGFLKYHHPAVAGGEKHWDYELFRMMPGLLAASSALERNAVLVEWISELGVPDSCEPCADTPQDPVQSAPIDWIDDSILLGDDLARALRRVYQNRFSGELQFYVTRVSGAINPRFIHEPKYLDQQPPDAGFRLLALMRFWNIVEYWSPNRYLIDDWESVLKEFLPKMVAAESWDAYRLELFALISRMQDGHANMWAHIDVRPPRGDCYWPVTVRNVAGQMVVTRRAGTPGQSAAGLEVGDVIMSVDGEAVTDLMDAWLPYYSASNEPRRLYELAVFLPGGPCGESELVVTRGKEKLVVSEARIAADKPMADPHDRSGEAFQMLTPEVAYLKLSAVEEAEIDEYLELASNTKGWIFDLRGYPAEFVVFSLGAHLVPEPTAFAVVSIADPSNPGTFTRTDPMIIKPESQIYDGQIVVMVDESTISSSEYTAMALRAAPDAIVIGSPTAGADGNVSSISLPGGVQTAISGIGVYYPDMTQTQRVGIVPDVEVQPSVEGIREGRDEVLEAAIQRILASRDN